MEPNGFMGRTLLAYLQIIFIVLSRNVYAVVNFLSQVIFIFLMFQIHLNTLPYPKTKEKQKLSEVKN